ERARLLAFTRRDIRRAGHELSAAARAELRASMARLVEIGIQFNQHIADVDDVMVVTDDDLDGLPDPYREGLGRNDDGTYRITMAYPDVVPFLEEGTRRERRQELSRLFENRAADVNRPLLAEAVARRERVAELFGSPSWAHHTMDEKMAHDPETVEAFYADLVPALTPKAEAEIAVMAARLAADTGDDVLQRWDWRFYDTELRRTEHGLDPHETSAYFPLGQVLDGLLDITAEVFGLEYRRLDDVPVWHPDVLSYAIVDTATGADIAVAHMDLHPREGKFSHAAAFDLVPGRRRPDGTYRTPVSCIVANFTKPTAERPSLLTHGEVVTFFHEFGHVLHQTLTKAETVRFSGTNTERDFVEAPSQIMEHWCWRAEVLGRFARHHETGEPIPAELVDRLVAARDLNVGVASLRQIQFGLLDMGLHGPRRPEDGTTADGSRDLDAILRRAEAVALLPHHEGTFFPASFGHLLSGYDAGYYGYLWSKVFGDDMFSRFATDGVTDPRVGAVYRTAILERGGSMDANEMLEQFLGRAPNNEAFLRGLGILSRA
ncbi:MAG: M3 family metallopeptidase, partial [Ilumatobacteraceae bacterium]